MKKIFVLGLVLLISFSAVACNQSNEKIENPLDLSWEETLELADGETVNFYYWGGSDAINSYFNDFIKPNLLSEYNVNFNPVPITDIKDIVNKVHTEKQAENMDGSVDIMWINGENFKAMKDNELLFGDLTSALPNFEKHIQKNPLDFNEKTEGLEVPFGKAQFVLVYDEAKVETEIKTLEGLVTWIKDNPGRFTYPSVPDFTGSAFIRHFYYGEEANGIETLKEINPYLWRDGETYPNSSGALDALYAQGEVDMTMSYTPFHGINKVSSGEFPETSKTLILEDGTLANTHFLTVPFNSQNAPAALVAINYLISFEAQYEKMKPSVWGDLMVLKNSTLSDEEREEINNLINEHNLNLEMFENNRLDEFSAKQTETIENEWLENLLNE